jgi:hypothetical protein
MGTILPIAGAVIGGVATMSPAGAMAGYSIGSGLSGAMGGGGGGGTSYQPGGTNATPMIATGPNSAVNNPDTLDRTWDSVQVNAPMTEVGNKAAAFHQNAVGAGGKGPSTTGGMGAGDYASLANMGLSAMGAASKAKRDQELADAAIWAQRNPLAGQVVGGPKPEMVGTSMGGFPTVGSGFVRY